MTAVVSVALFLLALLKDSSVVIGYSQFQKNVALVDDSFRLSMEAHGPVWECKFVPTTNMDSTVKFFIDKNVRLNHTQKYELLENTNSNFTLVIRNVILSDAGMYVCNAENLTNGVFYEVKANLTVLDPVPKCQVNNGSTGVNCSFSYNGEPHPELEWIFQTDNRFNGSCSASNGTMDCLIENPCAPNVHTQHTSTASNKCDCEWIDRHCSSDAVFGCVIIKDLNTTIGGWNCKQTSSLPATPDTNSSNVLGYIGMSAAVLVLLLINTTVVGLLIWQKKSRHRGRNDPDVVSQAASSENGHVDVNAMTTSIYSLVRDVDFRSTEALAPVYTAVKKTKNGRMDVTSMPASVYPFFNEQGSYSDNTLGPHDDTVVLDNAAYNSRLMKRSHEMVNTGKQTDGVVYAKLGPGPKNRTERSTFVLREPQSKSEYALIDHTSTPPPPLPPKRFDRSNLNNGQYS